MGTSQSIRIPSRTSLVGSPMSAPSPGPALGPAGPSASPPRGPAPRAVGRRARLCHTRRAWWNRGGRPRIARERVGLTAVRAPAVPAHRFAGQAAADDRWGGSGGGGAAPPDGEEMGRTKSPKKNIACLESLWDGNIESRLSVVPLLELASSVDEIRFSSLTGHTDERLQPKLHN